MARGKVNAKQDKTDTNKSKKRTKQDAAVAAEETKADAASAKAEKVQVNRGKDAAFKKSARLLEWEEPEKIALIEGWVRNGVSEKDIAFNMHCSYSTLKVWKKISSALSAALKKERDVADYIVEGALFKKACGHKETIRKPMKVKRVFYDSDTGRRISEIEEIVYVDEEQYIPPDTLADIFWLKNRKPEQWQDKVEQKIEADIDNNHGVVLLARRVEE